MRRQFFSLVFPCMNRTRETDLAGRESGAYPLYESYRYTSPDTEIFAPAQNVTYFTLLCDMFC